MKKNTVIALLVLVLSLSEIVFVTGSAFKIYSNNRIYKLIDENKTDEALKLIETMCKKDVNAYSAPLFLRTPMNTFTQGMWDIKLPLVDACEKGNLEIVEALLKKGADPNKFLAGNLSPIEATFFRKSDNRLEIAKLLIEYGADVNLCGSGTPALFLEASAILWNNKNEESVNEIFSLLIDNGANTVDEKDGYSVLHFSVHGNSVLVSENLINNYHIPINKVNVNGQTPLIMGAKNNAVDTVKLLIDHGADITTKDNDGYTAYDYALQNNNFDIIDLLVTK